jgi:GNAT superfamily N-acetyltransferase
LYEALTGEAQDLPSAMTQRVFTQIAALPGHGFLVAEENRRILGTLFLLIVPNFSHNARPWAILENIVVDGCHRRRGIGRRLIRHALKRCREADCYKVQLLSHKARHESHQFYRSLGFKTSALGFRLYC